jgi:hypothetical protein
MDPRRPAPARSALSPVVYEVVLLCLIAVAVVSIAVGLGVAAFELMRWPGFFVAAGATLLAAAWWDHRTNQPAPPPTAPERPPVTRSRTEAIEARPQIITRTWWRFAWLSKD